MAMKPSYTTRRDTIEALAISPRIVKVRLHLPLPYYNSAPSPEAPAVDHKLPHYRKAVALIEIAWVSRLAATVYQNSDGYAEQVERIAASVSAMGAFLVSGVYMFIRDGKLTTAGLRGSRPAQLIEQLGALNQVDDDVVSLFHRC